MQDILSLKYVGFFFQREGDRLIFRPSTGCHSCLLGFIGVYITLFSVYTCFNPWKFWENIVEKGENACMFYGYLTLYHIGLVQTESICRRQFLCGSNEVNFFDRQGRKHCRKRINDGILNFLLSPHCFTTQSRPLTTPRKKPFENIFGKGENAGNQHFLLFPQCFLP